VGPESDALRVFYSSSAGLRAKTQRAAGLPSRLARPAARVPLGDR